jgi:hypothetical protein
MNRKRNGKLLGRETLEWWREFEKSCEQFLTRKISGEPCLLQDYWKGNSNGNKIGKSKSF